MVPPPRPRVVRTSPAVRSAAIASRKVARETSRRAASSRSGGNAVPSAYTPSRIAVASLPTQDSNAWCPRSGRRTASLRSSFARITTRPGCNRARTLSMVLLQTIFCAIHLYDTTQRGHSAERTERPAEWNKPTCLTQGSSHMADPTDLSDDERRLAELGYKQELSRSWSGFSNFAISFSIISILAGCFTTFGQAWNNGGPVAISWGWPIISLFILIVGLTMSELVSAYPTSGGIYWWAAKMGGPRSGFYTGWLNLIGLLAVTASVAYGCATFLDLTISTFSQSWAEGYSLGRVYLIFVALLTVAAILNIYSGHLMAVLNNISVW